MAYCLSPTGGGFGTHSRTNQTPRTRITIVAGLEVHAGRIAELVAEAEAGFEVAQLKRRHWGRSARGAEPVQVIAVLRTDEELVALTELARKRGQTYAGAVREEFLMRQRCT